jgi:hypothetical integral membrane protein (TIGR02206 family)
MDAPRFVLFGSDHLAALGAVALATVAGVAFVRRDPAGAGARWLSLAVASALPALQGVEALSAWTGGWLTWELLPLHLCDVSLILAFVGLVSRRLQAAEPLYFFALAGTVPALFTPELNQGLPDVRFLVYFVPHGLVVVATAVLVLGFRLVPRSGAWWRALLLLNLWAVAVTPVNLLLGTNFLYLRAKPHGPTPFDWFGPWPFYILTLEVAFLVVFFLLDLPLRPLRRRWIGRSMARARPDQAGLG